MLIVCPTCASEYRIETTRVGMEGRSVRCAACRETWFITPAEVLTAREAELEGASPPEAAEETAAEAAWAEASAAVRGATVDATIDNVPAPPRRAGAKPGSGSRSKTGDKPAGKGRRIAGLSPALAAGLAVLAAVPLVCLARVPVVQALPQTAGLFARIGLPVNLRGLEIRDVAAVRNPAAGDGAAVLVVEGDLVGVARDGVPVPPLAVVTRDAAGRVVRTDTIAAPRSRLAKGETARFAARFADPPEQGRGIEVRFSDTAKVAADEDAGR